MLEQVIIPAAVEFWPQLILISAGFDAHHADPLADCSLHAESYAKMAAHVMNLAKRVGASVGAVLEGGYDLDALADSVLAMIAAFNARNLPKSIAPDPLVTSTVAADLAHY